MSFMEGPELFSAMGDLLNVGDVVWVDMMGISTWLMAPLILSSKDFLAELMSSWAWGLREDAVEDLVLRILLFI